MDSVPPTVVEDGGTRGPASRPRAAVRSFPSPRVRLFGRRARGPRRLGRVARVRRRRLARARACAFPTTTCITRWRRTRRTGSARARPALSPRVAIDRTSPHRALPPPTPRRASASTSTSSTTPRAFASRSPRPRMRRPAARATKTRSRPRWRATTTIPPRARGATPPRESASRASTPPEPPSPKTNSFPPRRRRRDSPRRRERPRACAFLLGEDSFEDVGRANRYPELAGVRSTVPPFPSTTARKRRASRGETRPGVYEPSATSTSARAVAMSEVDASVALARVVAEALLRPTNTPNGYDLSGWPDQTSTPVVERDEESATATTMAAESAAVDALAAAAGNLARSIATRLRVALDARATRTRAEARRIGSNGTSAAPVVTPCVATPAARAAVAGGEATFSSLVEYRRRGALERGRLAARAATATASARVKTEVHAVDAAVDAGRTSAPSSAAVAPRRRRSFCSRTSSGSRRDPDLRASLHRLAIQGACRPRIFPRTTRSSSRINQRRRRRRRGAVGGDGISAREHPRVRVATWISERHSTAWPSRARVVPASSRARCVRRLESINGGGGDGDHVRARRGEWFSTRRRAARLASRAISRRGDPARRRKRSTVRAPRAATDGGDATPGYGSGYRSGYGPGYGLERDGGRGTDVLRLRGPCRRGRTWWRRGNAREPRRARGRRNEGGSTRETCAGVGGEARTCSARVGEANWEHPPRMERTTTRTRSDRLEARYGMFQRVLEQIIPSIDGLTRRSSTV